MSNMKQTPSSIDAPSKEFLDQRDVELELMDSNGWHPRLRVKDQTNIDRMLAAGSISTHQWVAGTELAAWAYKAYGSVGSSMSKLDKPVGGNDRGFVSQSELNARQSLDQTRRHVIAEEGRIAGMLSSQLRSTTRASGATVGMQTRPTGAQWVRRSGLVCLPHSI